MTNLQEAKINTAGAYVSINGLYPFVIGARSHNNKIPVIRLGGHLQENETGWQCAVREVYEEANLRIRPLIPETTYWLERDHLEAEFKEIRWKHKFDPTPILVVSYRRENQAFLSVMYLAQADDPPTPSSEIKGILMLNQSDVHRLCEESLTLEQYLSNGGKAILHEVFDKSLVPYHKSFDKLKPILCEPRH